MVIEVLTMSFTVELHTKLRGCSELHHPFFSRRYVGHQGRGICRGESVRVQADAREQQIVTELRRGDTTRQMGDAHALGRQTVKNYVTTIYEKFGVSGRVELRQTAPPGGSTPQHL
jgi:DNA-binding CsgD family transcriptional regulator